MAKVSSELVPISYAPPHPTMTTAVDRMLAVQSKSAGDLFMETLAQTRPTFVPNFHPRVERSGLLSMYTRAHEDMRPASIAHLAVGAQHKKVTSTVGDSQWRSVALGATVGRSFLDTIETTGSAIYAEAPVQPDRLISMGEKKNLFEVERIGEDEYCFTLKVRGVSRGPKLEPGMGAICDRDTVTTAVTKLHALFPTEVPLMVHRGDAVAHGTPPTRHVRTGFESRGRLLIETEPIGQQCLKQTFGKYFHPRAERVARVNLAARARQDDDHRSFGTSFGSRPDSVAFLRTSEYNSRSTFKGSL